MKNIEAFNKVQIDQMVFRSQHELVKKLRSGTIDQAMFLMTMKPEDPFILWNNTLYYLTQLEYRLLSNGGAVPGIDRDKVFEALLAFDALPESLGLGSTIIEYREKLKSATCSACTKNRYKSKIVHFFIQKARSLSTEDSTILSADPVLADALGSIKIPKNTILEKLPKKIWPEQDISIPPRLVYLLPKQEQAINMEACLDCVKKHLYTARVFYIEYLCGYTEHKQLCLAELQNAAWEALQTHPLLAGTISSAMTILEDTDELLLGLVQSSLVAVDPDFEITDKQNAVLALKGIATIAAANKNVGLLAGALSGLEQTLPDKAKDIRTARLMLMDIGVTYAAEAWIEVDSLICAEVVA